MLAGLLRLRRQLRGFDLVYDLQTSGRSSRYHALAGRPAWSGVARGASLPHANPGRDAMHTVARQRDQLAMAGVPPAPRADVSWLAGTVDLPHPYALLVPGAAPHRPRKRWPAERFGAVAARLQAQGITPVVAGTASEAPLARAIQAACPAAIDLTGHTSLRQLAAIAAGARFRPGQRHRAHALGRRHGHALRRAVLRRQ